MPKPSHAVEKLHRSQRLGEAVKKARQELGISQPELARRTGLSKSYLSYLEAGRYEEIGIGKFALLVDALDISADDLLARAGMTNKPTKPTATGSRLLATQFELNPGQTRSALDYLSFLQKQKPNRAKASP